MLERMSSAMSSEEITRVGEASLPIFEMEADQSKVPSEYYEFSMDYMMDLSDFSPNSLSFLLLRREFENDKDAWAALFYAYAISAIRFEVETGQKAWPELKDVVGQSAVLFQEMDEDRVEIIKTDVEASFNDEYLHLHQSYLADHFMDRDH